MASLPGGYLTGPVIGGITPIYNQFSGNLAGYMDANGDSHLQTSGLENLPQTYAEATAAQGGGTTAAAQPAAGVAQPAAFTGNYASAPQSYLGSTGAAPQSFASAAPQSFSGASMANGSSPTINSGGSQVLYKADGTPLSSGQTSEIMRLYQAYEGGDMKAGQAVMQWDQALGVDPGYMDTAISNLRQGTGFNAPPQNTVQPETAALQQIAGIDPASETLRTALSNSYLTPLQQAQSPSAADYQTYLNQFKQLDPEEYAQRQGLATSMDSYLKQAQDQANLGSKLDPVTARQVEQQTRLGQVARGNVYGTPQMVEEAMTTGQAGLALQQQRQAQLGTALGAQQSYLGAGLGLGDTALSLYQQNRANLQNAQSGALSYLGSGQTPYQTGASYVNQANMNAATAAQGGPQYNPSALGAGYGAAQIPQYGLDIGQQAQNWYNSFSAYGAGGAPVKNKGAAAASGAATGALSGAVGGATLGSVVPGVGTLVGAGVGAVAGGVLGGAGGYFS
jgi:hypothetical protein